MSHLKSLKVVDLKNILSKASLSAPARATKADLIARILDNHSTLQVYYSLYPEHAPSAAVSSKPVESPPETPVTATSITPQAPSDARTEDADPTTNNTSPADSDVEKCKRRAERFGVPLTSTPSNPTADPELEKRKMRAERFGIPLVGAGSDKMKVRAGQKRSAPAEVEDKDEEERRRKRAERFGLVM